ncbi:MAG TPA: hypothetical protein VJ742_09435, partial [Nitrososphaera sp.]|nr:hypothetical protein [Nitrososphaera sp.]
INMPAKKKAASYAEAIAGPLTPVKEPIAEKKVRASRGKTPKTSFGGNYGTAQIYSKGFEFAFMSPVAGGYEQACTFVYCKDFLHDAVWAMVNKAPWQIYGFKYDPNKDKHLDLKNCTLAFRNTQYKNKPDEFHAQMKACQSFLNGMEKRIGFKKSKFYQVENPDGPCWLIVGDKKWQHAAPLLGLFTIFIRLGFAHDLKETADQTLEKAYAGEIKIGDSSNYAGNNDCGYLQSAKKGVELMLSLGTGVFHPKMEDNYPMSLKTASLHDSFGPVNFTRGSCKKAMPFWFRDEIWKSEPVATKKA